MTNNNNNIDINRIIENSINSSNNSNLQLIYRQMIKTYLHYDNKLIFNMESRNKDHVYKEHKLMLQKLVRIFFIGMVLTVVTIILCKQAKINPSAASVGEIVSNIQTNSEAPIASSLFLFLSRTFYTNKKFNWLNLIFLFLIPFCTFIYVLNLYKLNLFNFVLLLSNNLEYLKYIWLSGIFIGILYYIISIFLMEFFYKNKDIILSENYPQFLKKWLTALYLVSLNNDHKEEQKEYKKKIIMYTILLISGIYLL